MDMEIIKVKKAVKSGKKKKALKDISALLKKDKKFDAKLKKCAAIKK